MVLQSWENYEKVHLMPTGNIITRHVLETELANVELGQLSVFFRVGCNKPSFHSVVSNAHVFDFEQLCSTKGRCLTGAVIIRLGTLRAGEKIISSVTLPISMKLHIHVQCYLTSGFLHFSKLRLSASCGRPRFESAWANVSLWPKVAWYSRASCSFAIRSSVDSITLSSGILGWRTLTLILVMVCAFFLRGGVITGSSSSPRNVRFLETLLWRLDCSSDKGVLVCLCSSKLIAESISLKLVVAFVGDGDRIDRGVKKAPAQNSQNQSSAAVFIFVSNAANR